MGLHTLDSIFEPASVAIVGHRGGHLRAGAARAPRGRADAPAVLPGALGPDRLLAKHITGVVLPENEGMLTLVKKLGFTAVHGLGEGVYRIGHELQ